ncbi:MAG TPA: ammonia channel protein, partial [Nitrospiraceae bacterium]|nr:ammonia channel protein [Nitrospiraceae bacterium]
LLFGGFQLLGAQIVAALAVAAFSMLGTWLILTGIDRAVGLRVSQQEEEIGLDLSQHNERAYSA